MGRTIKTGSVKAYIDNRLTVGNDGAVILDEDTMSSDSATKVPTQQSVRAYVINSIEDILGYNVTTDGGSTFNTTAAETSVLSGGTAITIGAGYFSPPNDLVFRYVGEHKNNTGSAVTFTTRFKFGGQTLTGLNAYSQATNAFSPRILTEVRLTVVTSTTVRVSMQTFLTTPLNTTFLQNPISFGTLTVPDMDVNNTSIDFTVQMGTSDINAEVNPSQAMLLIERNKE